MELSQVFNATQRPTSPLQGLVSDPLSDRPSPDLFDVRRNGMQPTGSSPLQLKRTIRASTEPQSDYITMEESQEERIRRLREEALSSTAREGYYLDDGLDLEQESISKRRKEYMKKINEDAVRQFTNLEPNLVDSDGIFQDNSAEPKHRQQRALSAGDIGQGQALVALDDAPLAEEDTDFEADEEAQTQIAFVDSKAGGPRSRNVAATPNKHFFVSNQKSGPVDVEGFNAVAVADSQRSQLDTPYAKVFGVADRLSALPSSVDSRELVVQSQHMRDAEASSLIPQPPPISSGTQSFILAHFHSKITHRAPSITSHATCAAVQDSIRVARCCCTTAVLRHYSTRDRQMRANPFHLWTRTRRT